MADLKISALTGASTPLAGTEVLPIVQSGSTVKVSVANLTAGRQVALSSAVAGTGLTAIPWTLNATSSFYQAGTISSVIGTAGIVGVGTEFVRNAYYDGSWKYVGAGTATRYVQTGGQHVFYRAISGTANAAVTWVQNFTVSSADDVTANAGNIAVSTAGKGFTLPGGITWTSGAGSPEGAVTAPVGSLYSRSDGGLLTSLYVKESGSGNTGWVGK